MNSEVAGGLPLLCKLKHKKGGNRKWKLGQVTLEEYRYTAWTCKDGIRKGRAHLELNFCVGDMMSNKVSSRYIDNKRKTVRNVSAAEWGGAPGDKGQCSYGLRLNTAFNLVFTGLVLHQSQGPETSGKGWNKKDCLSGEDHLGNLWIHWVKTSRMHPWVLMELISVTGKLLSILFQKSWQLGKVQEYWQRANITVFKEGEKEDMGNYRPGSLISVTGKEMEHIILKNLFKQWSKNSKGWE